MLPCSSKAAAGAYTADVAIALRMVLALEGVECPTT